MRAAAEKGEKAGKDQSRDEGLQPKEDGEVKQNEDMQKRNEKRQDS